ncbi:MAG: phosphate ABC transporter, permease protein PstA [Omnitrophica bacterium RIFCSPLOWO2_01_FULL_50_24]|nr:MAG: phosphate ABC transporter, permease protein PstA [Omnitrophica bacterium RIFCSPLOWO2_01_FULL_50_24]
MRTLDPRITQRVVFSFLFLSTLVVVIPVVWVVGVIVARGSGVLNMEFLTQMPRMGMRAGGIFPAIVGTLALVLGTLIFALPVGIFSAIYLTEYSKRNWLTRFIELAIVNLAGVPSVVFGLFGLGLFVIFFRFGASILAGSLTLAVMSLPVMITAAREALQSVPSSFREVSYSLGATKWQTVRHAVLPHALPGILTGTVLSLSRAAGETAPILFTVAAFYLPRLPQSMFDQAMALPYHLYVLSTQVPNVKLELQYGTALVLVGLIIIMNLVATVIRSYFRAKKQW